MSFQIARGSGLSNRVRRGIAGGFLLAAAFLGATAGPAGAAVDPMAAANPSPAYVGAPDVAPPRGGVIAIDDPVAQISSARGGVAVPNAPRVSTVSCIKKCISAREATPGAVVRITGGYLGSVTRVAFRGRKGWIRSKWTARTASAVRAIVPKKAVDGRVFVIDRFGVRSNQSPRILAIGPVSRIPREVFPVRGKFSYGSSGSRFGAGRSGHTHQGQDLGAACGIGVASVRDGQVIYNSYQAGGAGNYLVIHNTGTDTNFVYMHLKRRSPFSVGAKVQAGTPIGQVGNTGRSFGCHLHFEYWVGPWQSGGKPIDPLPYLKSLVKK